VEASSPSYIAAECQAAICTRDCESEFLENVLHVLGGGCFSKDQSGSDLLIGAPLGHQSSNLTLTCAQMGPWRRVDPVGLYGGRLTYRLVDR
jgi:hypothetical protein